MYINEPPSPILIHSPILPLLPPTTHITMHLLRISLASVAFLALRTAAQIGEYDPIYSDYNYCQGITPDSKTYKPIVRLMAFQIL